MGCYLDAQSGHAAQKAWRWPCAQLLMHPLEPTSPQCIHRRVSSSPFFVSARFFTARACSCGGDADLPLFLPAWLLLGPARQEPPSLQPVYREVPL